MREEIIMIKRFKVLGVVLAVVGLGFIGGGIFAYTQVQAGYESLEKFSAAQNVVLTYNEDGQLVDRGEVEGAQAILSLLEDDWGYQVKASELNPNDPLVNTASEYMYQMALVAYHTLHSTQTVTLTEDVEYNGTTYEAGTYEFDVDGRYWADFDRQHPIEGAARGQAWTGVAHALIGELGVGSVTASTLQLGTGVAGFMAGVGSVFILLGLGLVWAAAGDKNRPALKEAPAIEKIDETVSI
jgi:hypothetical protein